MEPNVNTSAPQFQGDPKPDKEPGAMIELSPLDLNNIRLDVKHTILTPEYLESLASQTAPKA